MCRKNKTNKTKTSKKKKSGSVTAKSSGYYPELTTSAGPESDKRTGKEKFDSNPARQYSVSRKKKKKKKAKQAAARQAALEAQTPVDVVDEQVTEPVTPDGEAPQLPMDPVDETMGPQTGTETPDEPISQTDIETATGGTVGETAVTAQSIYQRDPEEAISDQERLAQEELRRQRIKRARAKQSLLRRRLERSREVGSGRRVLSGTERELNVQTRQTGTGRRRGAGRRSLITGSTGGIGYYSRFL
jgi:hypothetical protein